MEVIIAPVISRAPEPKNSIGTLAIHEERILGETAGIEEGRTLPLHQGLAIHALPATHRPGPGDIQDIEVAADSRLGRAVHQDAIPVLHPEDIVADGDAAHPLRQVHGIAHGLVDGVVEEAPPSSTRRLDMDSVLTVSVHEIVARRSAKECFGLQPDPVGVQDVSLHQRASPKDSNAHLGIVIGTILREG